MNLNLTHASDTVQEFEIGATNAALVVESTLHVVSTESDDTCAAVDLQNSVNVNESKENVTILSDTAQIEGCFSSQINNTTNADTSHMSLSMEDKIDCLQQLRILCNDFGIFTPDIVN